MLLVSLKTSEKLKAVIGGNKTVHFGSVSHNDYTKHKDDDRKQRYIDRHKKNENWIASGVDTAGFM